MRILHLRLSENWDVLIGVLPDFEEIFVGIERARAGGIGVGAAEISRLQSVGASYAQVRKGTGPAVPNYAVVVDNFLKFCSCGSSLTSGEVCVPPHISRMQTGHIQGERDLRQFELPIRLQCWLQSSDRSCRIFLV